MTEQSESYELLQLYGHSKCSFITDVPGECVGETIVGISLGLMRCGNPRFDGRRFEKLLSDEGIVWCSLSVDCCFKAIAAVRSNYPFHGFHYINEIQSMERGFGKVLLDCLMRKYGNVWLMSNPECGDGLKEYYRSLGLDEITVRKSVYGKPVNFFCTYGCNADGRLEDYVTGIYSH